MSTTAPTLHTPRLILRAFRGADFAPYMAMWSDIDTIRYLMPAPLSRDAAWDRFVRQAGMWALLGFGFFAVEERATGAFVGEVGFQDRQRGLTPSLDGTMETGWGLVSSWHGQGLASEAMQAAIGWAAAHGTRPRLTCMIRHDNAASLKVARKLGFSEFARAGFHGDTVVLMERPRVPS